MATGDARFTVVLEEGPLVCVRLLPAIVLDDSDGELLTAHIRRALPQRCVRLLMLLNGMASLSRDALSYFASHAPLSAVGLVGPSVLDQPLIELYLEVYRPPFPVAYFGHEGAARTWLARQPCA